MLVMLRAKINPLITIFRLSSFEIYTLRVSHCTRHIFISTSTKCISLTPYMHNILPSTLYTVPFKGVCQSLLPTMLPSISHTTCPHSPLTCVYTLAFKILPGIFSLRGVHSPRTVVYHALLSTIP